MEKWAWEKAPKNVYTWINMIKSKIKKQKWCFKKALICKSVCVRVSTLNSYQSESAKKCFSRSSTCQRRTGTNGCLNSMGRVQNRLQLLFFPTGPSMDQWWGLNCLPSVRERTKNMSSSQSVCHLIKNRFPSTWCLTTKWVQSVQNTFLLDIPKRTVNYLCNKASCA